MPDHLRVLLFRKYRNKEEVMYSKGVRTFVLSWCNGYTQSIEVLIFNSVYVFKEEMLLLGSDFKYSF